MTETSQLDEAAKILSTWVKDSNRIIIGLDGYAGSGKTTIAHELLALYPEDMEVIHLDDFIQPVEKRIAMIHTFSDPSVAFEKYWYRLDILQEILIAYKKNVRTSFKVPVYDFDTNTLSKEHTYDLSKKILLVEGVFLFHPENPLSEYFDKKIFLTTPFHIADSRRIQREKEKWGEHYLDESHPDNWTRHFITAYKRYYSTYHPESVCDLEITTSL